MNSTTATFAYTALVLVCISLFGGCMSTTIGTDFNSANVSKIKVGQTTEQEVKELIGTGCDRTHNSDGTVTLFYMYVPGKTVTPLSGLDPHLAQHADAGTRILEVDLDANGKVKDFSERTAP